jgi:hypothetical protein
MMQCVIGIVGGRDVAFCILFFRITDELVTCAPGARLISGAVGEPR